MSIERQDLEAKPLERLRGQTLNNRYRIQSLLGKQAGRRTFLAIDQDKQSQVVLKLLLFGPDFSWEDLKLFEREATTLKSLVHAAIPQYQDYFDVETALGKGFALVQGYIEARSLKDWADQGRTFSEEELRAIASQLLNILDYLHCQQPPIIHRDIKPSNILLTDNRSAHAVGEVHLIDFGSVQSIKQLGTLTVVGTYGYMPIEQFSGQATPQSDLFSLGATLLYLITRIHPAELPRLRGEVQFETGMSSHFQAWLRQMLRLESCDRPQSAQEALNALQDEAVLKSVSQNYYVKPAGSRVVFSKDEMGLSIFIPSPTQTQKINIVITAFKQSLFCSLPSFLLVFHIPLGTIATLISIGLILQVWKRGMNACLFNVKLTVNQDLFVYQLSSSPWEIQRFSDHLSHITKIEKAYTQHTSGEHYAVKILRIWVGTQCLTFPSWSVGHTSVGLTAPEVDWLAYELSTFLNLPLENQSLTPAHKVLQPLSEIKASSVVPAQTQTQGDSLSNPLISSPIQSRLIRPHAAICQITKASTSLEVIAPATIEKDTASGAWMWACIICMIFSPSLFSLFLAYLPQSLLVLGVGLLMIPFVGVYFYHKQLTQRLKTVEVIVNSRNVCLWEKHNHKAKRIRQLETSSLCQIQIAFLTIASLEPKYQVKLMSPDHEILVGNRSFWLSKDEAYWIASELKSCLKVPVTELEVIRETSGV